MIVIDLVTDKSENKFAPYQRMANCIINVAQKNGRCLPKDLLAAGFTREETSERWHMAYAMAKIELKIMGDEQL